MSLMYGLIWGCTVLGGAATVGALTWALRHGQLSRLDAAAASIFDDGDDDGDGDGDGRP